MSSVTLKLQTFPCYNEKSPPVEGNRSYVDGLFQTRVQALESHTFKPSFLTHAANELFWSLGMISPSNRFTLTFILQGQDDTLENGAGNYRLHR